MDALPDILEDIEDVSITLNRGDREDIRAYVKEMRPTLKEKVLVATLTEYVRGESTTPLNQRIRRILREDDLTHQPWLS